MLRIRHEKSISMMDGMCKSAENLRGSRGNKRIREEVNEGMGVIASEVNKEGMKYYVGEVNGDYIGG